ncbi:MAG: ParB N-terminal domain-containing protein [Bacteroidales bacterium]|nr:ParB N-terminal domain-containing protein [Bacteroidales bacterium]
MKRSITDCPEMLSLRELIVFPLSGRYVVVGGNLRLRACRELGYAELPCKVLPTDTPAAKLREIASKDNISFGENDTDIMQNEWDTCELQAWGVELPEGRKEKDAFRRRFDAIGNDDAVYPLIPKFDERHELLQGGERYNIYYDDQTERAPIFEKNLLKDGFHLLRWSE